MIGYSGLVSEQNQFSVQQILGLFKLSLHTTGFSGTVNTHTHTQDNWFEVSPWDTMTTRLGARETGVNGAAPPLPCQRPLSFPSSATTMADLASHDYFPSTAVETWPLPYTAHPSRPPKTCHTPLFPWRRERRHGGGVRCPARRGKTDIPRGKGRERHVKTIL